MNTFLRNKKITSVAVCLFTGLLLQSCAKNYIPSSNLDSKNFVHYFSPGKVTIYADEKDIILPHRSIGLVEGEACQQKAHHAPADEQTARTEARRNAYAKGANGIVFSGCVMIDTHAQSKDCINTLVCYGQAFQIEDTND